MDSIGFQLEVLEDNHNDVCRNLRVERRFFRNLHDPLKVNDTDMKKNYRLNRESFNYVLSELESALPSMRKSFALTPKQKLCALLRFLAEGSYQHGVGKDFEICMGQSTISKVIKETLDILEQKLCPKWINIKITENEKRDAKYTFYTKTNFPGVIMCVDGTHIKILPPAKDKHLYVNRKGFFSLNAMIICDNNMKIRFIDGRYPGCNHDSHVWKSSLARKYFEELYRRGNRNSWLLGDAGYPLEPWLLTPFRSTSSSTPENNYNTQHSKTRNIIERTIGVLKNRFRCLLGARQMHYTPQKAVQILNVCCALHNICFSYGIEYEEYLPDIIENDLNDEDLYEDVASTTEMKLL